MSNTQYFSFKRVQKCTHRSEGGWGRGLGETPQWTHSDVCHDRHSKVCQDVQQHVFHRVAFPGFSDLVVRVVGGSVVLVDGVVVSSAFHSVLRCTRFSHPFGSRFSICKLEVCFEFIVVSCSWSNTKLHNSSKQTRQCCPLPHHL